MSAKYEYPKLKVESPNVHYSVDEHGAEQLESLYEYDHVRVQHDKAANTIKVSLAYISTNVISIMIAPIITNHDRR